MIGPAIGLSTHRWRNNWKTILLIALYPFFVLGIAWLITGLCIIFYRHVNPITTQVENEGELTRQLLINQTNEMFILASPYIMGGVFIWFAVAWWRHSNMIRKMSGAKSVTRKDEPALHNLLANLCIARGMTMPKLQIIETHARNAFASGLSDSSYTITVTRGLLRSLKKDEVEAVLAHELAHIQNRDVRLLVCSIIICGLFGFLTQLCWSTIRRTFVTSSRRRRKSNRRVDIRILIAIALMGLVLGFGYLCTMWTRFALSRVREFDADAMAVEMTKNPEALMRALMRIKDRAQIPSATADIGLMCIENKKPFLYLFQTHPTIDHRLQTLSALTNTPIPDIKKHTAPAPMDQRFDQSDPDQKGHDGLLQSRHYLTKRPHNKPYSPFRKHNKDS